MTSHRPVTADQVTAEDPEVDAELRRTAVANQLAILVIEYRVRHGLTQTALARRLGMRQPTIARLEAADHEPSLAMLSRLVEKLGITLDGPSEIPRRPGPPA